MLKCALCFSLHKSCGPPNDIDIKFADPLPFNLRLHKLFPCDKLFLDLEKILEQKF